MIRMEFCKSDIFAWCHNASRSSTYSWWFHHFALTLFVYMTAYPLVLLFWSRRTIRALSRWSVVCRDVLHTCISEHTERVSDGSRGTLRCQRQVLQPDFCATSKMCARDLVAALHREGVLRMKRRDDRS